jgi:hypothetical protein
MGLMHRQNHELPPNAYNANQISAIPEPSSAILALVSVIALKLFRKKP